MGSMAEDHAEIDKKKQIKFCNSYGVGKEISEGA